MNEGDVQDIMAKGDDDAEDENPEDIVDTVEDDDMPENTDPTAAPNSEQPDGR